MAEFYTLGALRATTICATHPPYPHHIACLEGNFVLGYFGHHGRAVGGGNICGGASGSDNHNGTWRVALGFQRVNQST